ncbi:thioesterase domain-containing protein [Streptomyces sp. NPDC048643]|uniref:thioesterase II family protein n=1 Tax=Streptomyces sp. NPDC048643 TaxID=3155637 RepID=UPI0034217FD0
MHRTQEPQLRLFVFHHAGGSHLAYRDWPPCFPAGWQVHVPDAPGRGPRDERPALHDADALVDHYLHTLDDTMNGRFAFFGHSLGAIVAYELTRRLIDEGRTPPLWLGISARDPFPAIPHPHPHGTANTPSATGTTDTAYATHAPYAADPANTTAAAGTTYSAGTTFGAATATTFGAGAGRTRDTQAVDSTQGAGSAEARSEGGSAEAWLPGGSGEAGRGGGGRLSGEGAMDTVGAAGGGGRHLLSDAELRRQLAAMGGTPPVVLDHPQLWELFAPVIRADLRINETWRPGPAAAPLPVPLSVFGGREDQVAAPHLLGGWAQICEPFLGIRLFEGGHFYFQGRLPEVARHIQDDVHRALLHSRASSTVTS